MDLAVTTSAPSLQDSFRLRRAGEFANPRRAAATLPVIYGDLSQGQTGLWQAVCVDTLHHIYALAGCPLAGPEQGQRVRVFAADGAELFDFSYDPALALEGKGPIAAVTFAADQRANEPLGVLALGRTGTNGLMVNPVEIVRDFLVNLAGWPAEALDGAAWARATASAAQHGYEAAGVIAQDQALGQVLSEVLAACLGSWWLDAGGRLCLGLEGGRPLVSEDQVAFAFAPDPDLDSQVEADLKNLCNRISADYAYNWAEDFYEAHADGEDLRDPLSEAIHGRQERAFAWPWVRQAATARRLQADLVERFARPRRLISLTCADLAGLHLSKGDFAWYSSAWQLDARRQPLTNRLVQVLALEPDLDARRLRCTLLDTGFHRTLAEIADGAYLADGACTAGAALDPVPAE